MQTTEAVEALFTTEHLKSGPVRDEADRWRTMALDTYRALPSTPERTLALRALWEAKNLAVFAMVQKASGEVV